jgi:hypothetical protein
LSERETVLEAQLIGLGLWKIKYRRNSTIQIMILTETGSSTLCLQRHSHMAELIGSIPMFTASQ